MSRKWLFVPLLLLSAGVALAAVDVPETETETETDTKAVEAQTQPEEPQPAGAEKQESESDGKEKTADDENKPRTSNGAKLISGMSILGNQEAPKSLVIVPWKSSVLGDSLGIATMLDDSKAPIDREVFLRALTYYEIRSEEAP